MANTNERLEHLEKFLDFCQINLNELSTLEKEDLNNRLPTILGFGTPDYKFYQPSPLGVRPEDLEKIKTLQSQLFEDLQWVWENLNQDVYVETTVLMGLTITSQFRYEKTPGNYTSQLKMRLTRISEDRFKRTKFPVAKEIHGVFLNLFEALDGLNSSAVMKCPTCGRIFVNASRRKKKYCSQKCQNAAGVQRYRDKKKG